MTVAAGPSTTPDSLERRIGSRWLLYTGVVALLVGASCFIKLALDSQWITAAVQVLIGAAAGIALVVAGVHFVRSGHGRYGQAVEGAGLAVLYVSIYGAFNVYGLIAWPIACTLMIATTGVAAWLADVQRAQALALIAISGGFATPSFLAVHTIPQIPLFTFEGILVSATVVLARRRAWPVLCVFSYVSLVLTVSVWASRFYSPEKFLTTEIYLALYCAMFLDMQRNLRTAAKPFARFAAVVLSTAPVAFYVTSLAILDTHDLLFVGFLVAFSVSGAVLTRSSRSRVLPLVLWVAVQDPLFAWITDHRGGEWLLVGLASVASIYGVYLVSQLDALARRGWSLSRADQALIHLNGLAAAGGIYLLIDSVRPGMAGAAIASWALWQLALSLAVARRHRELANHFAILAITLAAAAIAVQFHGLAIRIGWAVEGAVVMWLGLRQRNEWLRGSGALLFAGDAAMVMATQFTPAPVEQLPLFNRRACAAALVILLSYSLAWLHHRQSREGDRWPAVAVLLVLANVLTLTLLTSEMTTLCRLCVTSTRELAISTVWIAHATTLAFVGKRKRYAPIRYLAIILFSFSTVKVFIVDFVVLAPLHRVASVAGLGIALLVTSYLYYRPNASVE